MDLSEHNMLELEVIGDSYKYAVNVTLLLPGKSSIVLEVSNSENIHKASATFNVIDPLQVNVSTYIGELDIS